MFVASAAVSTFSNQYAINRCLWETSPSWKERTTTFTLVGDAGNPELGPTTRQSATRGRDRRYKQHLIASCHQAFLE